MTEALSAIVPTLDEEQALGPTLERLLQVADEIVVSDGGSHDRTESIAKAAGARWVSGSRGRGAQLDAGARSSTGDLLLFVHADTLVPFDAGARIRQAVATGCAGGAFSVRFDAPGWRYRLGESLASARSRFLHLSMGDQAQFVRRQIYEQIGGFPDWPLLEDVEFALRLRRAGRIAILDPPVLTSARRFARRGPLRTVLRNWWILARFATGASPAELVRRYTDVR